MVKIRTIGRYGRTRFRNQRSTDGRLQRRYRVTCGMPYCTTGRTLTPGVMEELVNKRNAAQKLRSEGWHTRGDLGWTCGNHTGHKRRKSKREAR